MLASGPLAADMLVVTPVTVTEWKAVYGTVSPRTAIAARARIGGTVTELLVAEGDTVTAGQRLATIRDEKLGFQIAAYDAQIVALRAQLATAETELTRGQALVQRGVATAQQLDQLSTTVDVTRGQIAAAEAGREVVVQQAAEGDVLAPEDGRVLTVPVTRGAVVLPGEPVATIGSGGTPCRDAVRGRHDPGRHRNRHLPRAARQALSRDTRRPRHRRCRSRGPARRLRERAPARCLAGR
jgi:RND family efflux transporter MFP subunit